MREHPENINVFILYAEEDNELKQELEVHLSMLTQKGLIDVWHEGKIIYSRNADDMISDYIRQAEIVLLLISANFLAPECYGKYEKDIQEAYKRQLDGAAQIIPVILRPCVWEFDVLSGLNPLPKGGHAVRSKHWESRDVAFQNVTLGILNIVDQLKNPKTSSKPPPLPSKQKPPVKPSAGNHSKDQQALDLINRLFVLMNRIEPNLGAQRLQPLVHNSLIKNGDLDMNFKKYKFWKAYEKMHLYIYPVQIVNVKNSGRKSIGVLIDKEEGEEWMYTLKKIKDLGGISGQVRIFFPANGGVAKITSISL